MRIKNNNKNQWMYVNLVKEKDKYRKGAIKHEKSSAKIQ